MYTDIQWSCGIALRENAMKRKTTKDILAESFLELAMSKRIDKITITDITSNCGMSQPTFYNHFKESLRCIIRTRKKICTGLSSSLN